MQFRKYGLAGQFPQWLRDMLQFRILLPNHRALGISGPNSSNDSGVYGGETCGAICKLYVLCLESILMIILESFLI